MNFTNARRIERVDRRPVASQVKVLIAEGDSDSSHRLSEQLEGHGFTVVPTRSAREAIRLAEQELPDLVILDVYLPDLTGFALTRHLRESGALRHVSIMVVSARSSEMDRILAFEAGADGFLEKPFSEAELVARVGALVRSAKPEPDAASRPEERSLQTVRLDRRAWRAEAEGRPLDLTIKEFEILWLLVERGGTVVRRRELIESVWGPGARLTDRVVDSHVKSIRRKLGSARDLLETVRGVGYRFSDSSREKA